jgi:gliding motility-associated-like protein
MKLRLPLLILGFLIASYGHSQTVFWTEDFGTGCNDGNLAAGTATPNGTWTETNTGFNDIEANEWYISASEQNPGAGCSTGCGGANSRSLHIGPITVIFFGFPVVNADGGAHYLAQGVNGPATTDVRVESPTINCTGRSNITLSFNYLEFGDGANDDGEVWYFDGSSWALLQNSAKTTCCGGACNGTNQGIWATFTATLPATADNNPNVKIGFRWINNDDGIGTDPSFAIDDITLSEPSGALPVVTISPSPNDSLCVSSTLTLNGSATNGPISAWAWTVSPSTGVTFTPDTAAQNPTVTFTTPGTYTFTLQATNGSGNGSATQVITILPGSVPTVTITASPVNPVCAGTTVNFTATPTNGGATPSFQWQVNGVNAGANSANFSSSTLNNNDVITVTVTSSDSCALPATASDSYTVQVNPSGAAAVSIVASTTLTCAGNPISFTATPTLGGSSPSYQWQVNGVNAGTNSDQFSSGTLNNGDAVSVILTSNDPCASPTTANSNTITITITTSVVPTVTVAASTTTACAGTSISFTATPTNGGSAPVYQWQVNGVNAGTNSDQFSSSSLNNNDTVTVIMTSNDPCAVPSIDTSDVLVIAITPTVQPSVLISVSPSNTICAGATVNFTATPANGGSTPAYQWQVNGVNAGANSPNFSSSTLANGDTVAVIMTSSDACPVPAGDTDEVIMTVNPILVPLVGITPASPTVCVGDSIVFSASSTNGGSAPSFQWQVNGSNAGTNSNSFTLLPVAGGETVTVTMISNATCATPTAVTSNTVVVTANPLPVLTVSQSTATVCPNLPDTLFAAATAGSTFSWTPAAGLSSTSNDTVVASNAVTGSYTYYVTATLNGCVATDSITVVVANTFTATAGPALAICLGDSAMLSVSGGTTWTWTPAGDLSCSNCQNPVATPTTTTTYSAVANQAGCLDTVMQTITVSPNASASFNTTVLNQGIPQSVGFTNTSLNSISYFWTLGNGNTSVLQTPASQTYNAAGTYTVTLIAYGANGCNDTISTLLMVNDTVGISVPNIFTPNGDEINDVWKPSVHGATSFECTIYNRYGVLVYEFVSAQDKWDGHTTAGLACVEGTYYYILKATDSANKSYDLKGYIQLIK